MTQILDSLGGKSTLVTDVTMDTRQSEVVPFTNLRICEIRSSTQPADSRASASWSQHSSIVIHNWAKPWQQKTLRINVCFLYNFNLKKSYTLSRCLNIRKLSILTVAKKSAFMTFFPGVSSQIKFMCKDFLLWGYKIQLNSFSFWSAPMATSIV